MIECRILYCTHVLAGKFSFGASLRIKYFSCIAMGDTGSYIGHLLL